MEKVMSCHKSGVVIIGGDFHSLGIVRNLAELGIPIFVVYSGFSIARFSRFTDEFFKCPPLTDIEAFIDFLIQLGIDKKLEKTVVFPISDTSAYILAKNRERLQKYYLIPTPDWEITRFAHNKKLTYQLAAEMDVPIPKTFFPENADELSTLEMDFPVILKPAVTANFYPVTQLKAIRVNTHDELFRRYGYMSSVIDKSEIMVQEIIEGGPKNLYSFCSLFGNGTVKAKIIGVRLRQHPMDFGSSSTYVVTCEVPELEEPATRMLRGMNYYGLSEIEFMFDERDSTFKLLDINPRTWAWHTLGAKAGVNFSSLLYRDMHNEPVFVDSFERGVKWIREVTDVSVAVSEILGGRLKTGDYLQSLKGKKELAVYSNHDPLPFIAELFSAPYMWYKRRFRL